MLCCLQNTSAFASTTCSKREITASRRLAIQNQLGHLQHRQAEDRLSQVAKPCMQLIFQPQKKMLKFGVHSKQTSKKESRVKTNNICLDCTSETFLQHFLTCFWQIQLQCLHSYFLLCMLGDNMRSLHNCKINMVLYQENYSHSAILLNNPDSGTHASEVPQFKFPSSETGAPISKFLAHSYKSVSTQTSPMAFFFFFQKHIYVQIYISKITTDAQLNCFPDSSTSRIVSCKCPGNS